MTGALDGKDCCRLGRLTRVQRYLAAERAGLPIACYSDRHTGVPLLRVATETVPVNPIRRMGNSR